MLKVTVPSGKVYTFAPRNAARAHALAAKTGGFVTGAAPSTDDGYDAQRDADLLSGRRSAERYARYGRNLRMR